MDLRLCQWRKTINPLLGLMGVRMGEVVDTITVPDILIKDTHKRLTTITIPDTEALVNRLGTIATPTEVVLVGVVGVVTAWLEDHAMVVELTMAHPEDTTDKSEVFSGQ